MRKEVHKCFKQCKFLKELGFLKNFEDQESTSIWVLFNYICYGSEKINELTKDALQEPILISLNISESNLGFNDNFITVFQGIGRESISRCILQELYAADFFFKSSI
ncbi:hypothetical protein C2G38_2205542 [Gigaspora rosea]|uniref:Uncharacterized protein n=1 Tax=Gigaspora rosea TaxID=44941 RepID=A0A397UN36_9GLOM|nr:hypothetical protein C2G38_2205542 [Gigaspora rosea]